VTGFSKAHSIDRFHRGGVNDFFCIRTKKIVGRQTTHKILSTAKQWM
jgi:hypothetical protein